MTTTFASASSFLIRSPKTSPAPNVAQQTINNKFKKDVMEYYENMTQETFKAGLNVEA